MLPVGLPFTLPWCSAGFCMNLRQGRNRVFVNMEPAEHVTSLLPLVSLWEWLWYPSLAFLFVFQLNKPHKHDTVAQQSHLERKVNPWTLSKDPRHQWDHLSSFCADVSSLLRGQSVQIHCAQLQHHLKIIHKNIILKFNDICKTRVRTTARHVIGRETKMVAEDADNQHGDDDHDGPTIVISLLAVPASRPCQLPTAGAAQLQPLASVAGILQPAVRPAILAPLVWH